MECFTKYCVIREAIRHFRALRQFEGGTKVLHCDGDFGDPLSLYLRALCGEGVHVFIFMFSRLKASLTCNVQKKIKIIIKKIIIKDAL